MAFLARPIGSIVFGHFGDRVGRKSVLVTSLLLMGVSTALVGLLPGYATLGSWAPLLLVTLRFLQGIGIGGEWGGAVLLAVEHAPRGKRGLYAAFPQLGPPVGFSAATGVFWLVSASLDEAAFASWGWRIPFLLSFLLVAVGLVVRLKISETPVFARSVAERAASRAPLMELLRCHTRELLLGAGAMAVVYALFYTSMTYGLSYTTTSLGMPRNTMLALSLVACLFLAAGIWFSATRSDTDGRRRLVLSGCGLAAVWSLLLFPLLDTERPVLMALALGGALFCLGVTSGPMGAYLPELFPARVRYSGASLAYNLGGVLGARSPLGRAAPPVRLRLGVGGVVRQRDGPGLPAVRAGAAGDTGTRTGLTRDAAAPPMGGAATRAGRGVRVHRTCRVPRVSGTGFYRWLGNSTTCWYVGLFCQLTFGWLMPPSARWMIVSVHHWSPAAQLSSPG